MAFMMETDRLILQVEKEDIADQLLDFYIRNRKQFERFEPTRPNNFYTLAYQKASLRYEYNEIMHGKCLRYCLYVKEQPDVLIGSVNFSNFVHDPFSHTSIGYKLDHAAQKKGYAYEACMSTFDILHERYHINRIDARIHPDNTASIRLAEKIGFSPISYEPKSANILGHYVDLIRYSVTISDIQ